MWRDDTKQIYGFFDSGLWDAVADTWVEGTEIPAHGEPPPGLSAPVRGTGYVWGTNPKFFDELGWPTDEQRGFCALIQPFENGFILRSSRVESCKDNLFNQATTNAFRLDSIQAYNNGGWQSTMRNETSQEGNISR